MGDCEKTMREITLRPIKETTENYEVIEKKIVQLLREEIYLPLIRELGEKPGAVIKNSIDDLTNAILSGRITYSQGSFRGRFNSLISKELKELGAKWDRIQGTWKVPQSSLPMVVRNAIADGKIRAERKFQKIDQRLAQLLPEEIAERLKISDQFSQVLLRVDQDFESSIKGLTIAPKLTKDQREKISDEWQQNMKLWIKDFTEKEIVRLRKDVQTSVFSGNRVESMVKKIQKSYGVSQRKAKFLARQESSLLMTKFKETRYVDAGVNEYRWTCVAGSKNHPVRPSHKILDGKIFRWDNPPITTEPGETVRRNNPGQDYNCRCFAKPIVRFNDKKGEP